MEQAKLVYATDTTAVIHGMLDPLRGSTPPQLVRRYQITAEGQKYFQKIPGTLGQTKGFCYGQKIVATIIKWTEPAAVGQSSQTEVTYTYRIADPAVWAGRLDVQHAFPDVRANLEDDRIGWIAVDQQGLGSTGTLVPDIQMRVWPQVKQRCGSP